MNFTRVLLIASIALLSLALPACGGAKKAEVKAPVATPAPPPPPATAAPVYPKCETDTHCEAKGQVCVSGTCKQCREDAQCNSLGPCGRCQSNSCVKAAGCCEKDLDCNGGRCRGGSCR